MIVRENKQQICDSLLQTLQLTRMCDDLRSLEYQADTEIVVATFTGGGFMNINVACDSGIAMIRDICRAFQ